MTDPVLLVDVADRVALLTLNRPEARNALNRALRAALVDTVGALQDDPSVDVMVITGADPAFSAGIDLKELGGGEDDGQRLTPSGRTATRGPFPPLRKLLIGAVNGAAVTGGLEIALNCDFLVASDRARFADTHARVGIMPGWGLTVLLPQRVGVARAREMSVTGNFVGATTALQWGLVNHVVPHAELVPFTRQLALDATSIDQRAVQRMLRTYEEVTATTAQEGWDIELRVSTEWEGTGYDRGAIEARRQAIVDRGRSQLGSGSPPSSP
ncbi:MAG TPA: enoyl-CoA hydratase [Acidimicrobiales bacterium]|nr:enoyl-CoA hydratase [Acidimicrobiales bacterium]